MSVHPRSVTWLVNVRGLDPGRMEERFLEAEAAGCDGLYFEAADGSDGSELGYGAEFVALAKRTCTLSRFVHLRVARPERYVTSFVESGAQTIAVPAESGGHLQRTVALVREAGASPCVAINPATPLTKLEYLLPFIDSVLMLATEPGATQTRGNVFERVGILRRNIEYQKQRIEIFVAGLRSARDTQAAIEHGATGIVVGDGSGSNALAMYNEFIESALPSP